MEWGQTPLQHVNGNHTPSLLHYLDRLDGKMDTVLHRLGEGQEVHRRLTAESNQHRNDIQDLRVMITSIKTSPAQSRVKLVLDEMKTIMSLREWFFGAVLVGASVIGLKIPGEIRDLLIDGLTKAVGGG